ncbi:Dual specificity protein phosphatase 23, partial [Ophiophagus hannah]
MASALPPNFSWVVSGLLAGLAMPHLPAHYQYMHDHGIRHLVSLTERSPPYHDSCPGIQAVAVHCLLGFGRTGTMLACYLSKIHKITGVDAIQKLRQLRPGSIETYDQEKAVVQFYQRTK